MVSFGFKSGSEFCFSSSHVSVSTGSPTIPLGLRQLDPSSILTSISSNEKITAYLASTS